jgi:glycosyltransferase involved in cell wall biosynthesis
VSKRVLFLTQWFEPEPVMKGLQFARGLAEAGHKVEVATGFPNYPTGKVAAGYRPKPYAAETMEGIRIHRLFLVPSHDSSTPGRVANYLSFFVSALIFCLARGGRFDVIYVYHPPITVGLAAAISGLFNRTPFVLDVQDLWPDSVVASGMGGARRLGGVLGWLCGFVYRRAALVIGQSRSITERLVARGVDGGKALTIFNWADEGAAWPRAKRATGWPGEGGDFTFVFGGNLGRAQNLETLVRAAHLAARDEPRIKLTLVGEGVERNHLANVVAELGATSVQLARGVSRSEIGDIFASADVLVLHLLDDPLFAITIPSKLQFYMAMGQPILIGGTGEAALIVTESGAGVAVQPENVAAMAEAMVRMARLPPQELSEMGRRARAAYVARFSYAAAMSATLDCLDRPELAR